MILYKRRGEFLENLKEGLRNEPYLVINLFFAGLIIMVIAYSGIFSPDKNSYPVPCVHEILTGKPCFSCGLSHSFSLIVRGRIDEAFKWNVYGMQVFLFFVAQLVMRIVFSFLYIKYPGTQKQLIIFDSAGGVLIFLISFWPFIINLFRGF
jgi:hypothetical protein